jgi:hypothetical protein
VDRRASRRIGARAPAAAVALLAIAASPSLAATYRGAAVDDEQMPVKVKLSGDDLIFEYEHVLVECSDGSRPRQGGASHTDRLNERGRFKDHVGLDRPEPGVEKVTSVVKGKVRKRKAAGTLTYDLKYEGGECHSGVVEWKAKRK